MKDDEELDMLLGEIPHAISLNPGNIHHHHLKHGHGGDHHHDGSFRMQNTNGMIHGMLMYDDDTLSHHKHTCASPGSGFSLQSDGSSSSLFSGGHSLSDNGSPTTRPLEELKPHLLRGASHCPNRLLMDFKTSDSSSGKETNENVIDDLNLSRNLSRMYIGGEPEDVQVGPNDRQYYNHSGSGAIRLIEEQHEVSDNYRNYGKYQFPIPRSPVSFDGEVGSGIVGLQHQYQRGNMLGTPYSCPPVRNDELFSNLNIGNSAMSSELPLAKGQVGQHYQMGIPVSNLFGTLPRPSSADVIFCAQRNGVNVFAETGTFGFPSVPQMSPLMPHNNVENLFQYHQSIANARNRLPLHVRIPRGGLEPLTREDSLIVQGDTVNYAMNKGYRCSKGHNKGFPYEAGVSAHQEKRLPIDGCLQIAVNQESARSLRMCCPFSQPSKCNSLAEAQGYIYYIAKDQHGCRFLQRMFDEGTPQDVEIIFNEIIEHVVELMMNPFGNYLMQKLLEVCNEDQRMQILLRVTVKPGELIRISLNTHGTRVVQKLIETLKSRQQISLVISALEPGFLALIKDLNGNHVVQRCLQCLSNEDSKFIFVAAAKYCVDIATHQHGCCVLQRCISHSTGEHRENLIAEISANGLLLSQDAFGNYVVQFILELKIPSATTRLVSQFDGNYVHLSMQKFSSHVVEKCLLVCNKEVQSKIIQELLSATHFEQLLQDPHANYVVQTALKVSEGPLHNSLIDAIESHKAISRNSPYSKRIFSHKLLKK